MYFVRRWSTRNAGLFERLYKTFAYAFHRLDPLWARIGMQRLEKPFAACEAAVKGLLFDCRMCGRCVLSSTGMTCPTNCPKSVRNGPCGGVRANGHCEVEPDMHCVWVEAWSGSNRMRDRGVFHRPLPPREYHIDGSSAWLRLSSENIDKRDKARAAEASSGADAA
jgi:hypothetical protein